MEIEIKSILLIHGTGPDTLIFKTNLPNGMYPFTGSAEIQLAVAADTGEKYIADNFPNCKVEIINGRAD